MSQIQEKRKVEKNRILIHNDEGNILIMNGMDKNKIYIPTFSVFEQYTGELKLTRYQSFFESIGSLDDKELLYQAHVNRKLTEVVDGKRTLVNLKEIRNYFSLYHNLTKEDITKLMKIAYAYGFQPHMVSLKEILSFSDLENLSIEREIVRAAKRLKKKLDYKIY